MCKPMLTLCGLLSCIILLAVVSARPDPIYTVPQVLAGLNSNPAAWIGRTALVQGSALSIVPSCGLRHWCPSGLYAPKTPRPGPILLLEPGPADPLIERLRHLPLLGTIVPRPQRMREQTPAVYRLRFQAVPHVTCDNGPCVTALLVDAAQ